MIFWERMETAWNLIVRDSDWRHDSEIDCSQEASFVTDYQFKLHLAMVSTNEQDLKTEILHHVVMTSSMFG